MSWNHRAFWPILASIVLPGAMCQAVACHEGPLPGKLVTPGVKAGCILLRAITEDGTVDEVCATAEDLAPLIGEILAEHDKNRAAAEKASPLVAFTIAPPKRPAPKRRCSQWVTLSALHDGGDGGR